MSTWVGISLSWCQFELVSTWVGIYQHQTGTHTDTRCDCCHEQKIIDRWYTNWFIQHETGFFTAQDGSYDTKRDSLLHKTVHTAPYEVSYRTRRCIRHHTRFLTAQDGSYGTIRDSLLHKTVHTAPYEISYHTRQCIQHQTGFLTAQDSAYSTKWDSLPHKTVQHQTGFPTAPNRSLTRLNENITNIKQERTLTPDRNDHYRCKLVPAQLGVSTVDLFGVSVFLFRVDVPFEVTRRFLFGWHNEWLHY
jgi:hypothetical protein